MNDQPAPLHIDARLLARPRVILPLLLLLCALMLRSCWNTPFYHVDDIAEMQEVAAGRWTDAFRPRQSVVCPVTWLSHCADYALFSHGGKSAAEIEADVRWAGASRGVNALLHAAAALLLLALLKRLGATPGLAAAVALVWATHPTALESVCWAAERRSVLAACLGLGALLAFAARPRAWTLALSWLLYFLALFAKPSVLGFFAVLAAIEYMRPPTPGVPGTPGAASGAGKRWRCAALRLLPFVPILLAGARLSYHAYAGEIVAPPGGSAWTALLTDTDIFGRYLLHAFAPINLSFYYAVKPILSLADPRLWINAAAILAFIAALCWLPGRGERRLAAFGVFWFFAALAQNTNVVAHSYPMQDRFIYLPMPGILLAGFLALKGAARRLHLSDGILKISGAAYICFIAIAMLLRAPVYGSSDLLELQAAQRQPGTAVAHLAAARIFRVRAVEEQARGGNDNARDIGVLVNAALEQYDAAERCADIRNFSNLFDLRVARAELFLLAHALPRARAELQSWLPPRDLPLLPEKTSYTRREHHSGYRAEELAHAWAVMGEIRLRESLQPTLPLAGRLRLHDEAIRCARASSAAHENGCEGALLQARALILKWTALEQSGDAAGAQAARDEARGILQNIPPAAANGPAAQALLHNVFLKGR